MYHHDYGHKRFYRELDEQRPTDALEQELAAAEAHYEEVASSNYGADNPGAVYAAEDRLEAARKALKARQANAVGGFLGRVLVGA